AAVRFFSSVQPSPGDALFSWAAGAAAVQSRARTQRKREAPSGHASRSYVLILAGWNGVFHSIAPPGQPQGRGGQGAVRAACCQKPERHLANSTPMHIPVGTLRCGSARDPSTPFASNTPETDGQCV